MKPICSLHSLSVVSLYTLVIVDLLIIYTVQETNSSFATKILLLKLNNACFALLLQLGLKVINSYSLKQKAIKIQLGKHASPSPNMPHSLGTPTVT